MEVKVNGFKYSALSSGVILLPFTVPNNLVFATRSSCKNFTFPEES